MDKKKLIELVKAVDYLNADEKKKWLDLIPDFNESQLKKFAGLIGWAEEQKTNLDKERALVEGSFYQLFAVMKRYGAQQAKKETHANWEEQEKVKDEKSINNLLEENEQK